MTSKKRLEFSNFSWRSNIFLESFRHFVKGISFHKHVFKHVRETGTGTNKNQAQSRKFNNAHLTRNVSTPVFRGSVRKLCAHLFTRVLELFHKRKCLNFHEMLSKKTHL